MNLSWAIDDSMVKDHEFPAYPISLNLDRDVIYFDEDGLDYGAYLLDPMAIAALNESGITPIRQEQWDTGDLNEFPFWSLIGLSIQLAELEFDGSSTKSHVTVHMERLPARPVALGRQSTSAYLPR